MKRIVLLFGLVSCAGTLHAEGAFCVVTNYGNNCQYYEANRCREDATRQRGMCIVNPASQSQAPRFNVMDAMQQIQDSGEKGARLGQERTEHRARMELLQAQTEAVRSDTQSPAFGKPFYESRMDHLTVQAETEQSAPRLETNIGYRVMYKCPDTAGVMQYSGVPARGCVVESVTAY